MVQTYNLPIIKSKPRTNGGSKGKTKIEWPTDEKLVELVKDNSLTKVGAILGVSANAVKKRLTRRGLI